MLQVPVALLTLAAATSGFVNEQYELTPVAPGVYSFLAPESDSGVVQGNCTLILGEDAALVVDSGQFPSLARRMVADIQKLTQKPVRYLVNTHWHFDHVWGNAVFREAFPGILALSTEFTRTMIENQGPKFLAKTPQENRDQAANFRKMAAGDKLPDGRPLPDETRRFLTRLADTLAYIEPDLLGTVHSPPVLGFEGELTIDLGKRVVKVKWLGRANTGGDAVVWVPDAKVLATGDAVVYPAPFAFGSYMTEWPVTLQKMLDLGPAIVIPGHGPVMHDVSYLATLIEMFQALTTQVREAVAQKLSLEDIRRKVTLDAYASRLAGDDPMRRRGFRSFLHAATERAYQEATGTLKPEGEE